MKNRKLLLLNGSPRKKGTSFTFARTLMSLAEQLGNSAQIVHVYDYFDGKEEMTKLLELLRQSDIIGLLAPLYVDTLPYPDLWLLEKLSKEKDLLLEGKSFFAIGQCGFPDITRCEPLIDTCMYFAQECKMNWLGGLGYGGGPMINGALLEELGKKGEKMTLAFKRALEAVFDNKTIPIQCQELLTLNIPKWLYRPLAMYLNNHSKKEAKKQGVKDIRLKAYLM